MHRNCSRLQYRPLTQIPLYCVKSYVRNSSYEKYTSRAKYRLIFTLSIASGYRTTTFRRPENPPSSGGAGIWGELAVLGRLERASLNTNGLIPVPTEEGGRCSVPNTAVLYSEMMDSIQCVSHNYGHIQWSEFSKSFSC